MKRKSCRKKPHEKYLADAEALNPAAIPKIWNQYLRYRFIGEVAATHLAGTPRLLRSAHKKIESMLAGIPTGNDTLASLGMESLRAFFEANASQLLKQASRLEQFSDPKGSLSRQVTTKHFDLAWQEAILLGDAAFFADVTEPYKRAGMVAAIIYVNEQKLPPSDRRATSWESYASAAKNHSRRIKPTLVPVAVKANNSYGSRHVSLPRGEWDAYKAGEWLLVDPAELRRLPGVLRTVKKQKPRRKK